MSIQFVTCATGQNTAVVSTAVNIVVPVNANSLMIIKTGGTGVDNAIYCPSSVTVSGFAASLWCCKFCFNGTYPQCGKTNSVWYLCNPPTGAVIVTVDRKSVV